jgi:polygalacturonase
VLDTGAITAAIKAASAAGASRIFFPTGTYLTGTFELLSNVERDLTAGAVIQASKNVTDYASIAEYGFGTTYGVDSTGEGDLVGIIVARNAENIGIVGQGAIDGSGDDFFDFSKPHHGKD